MNSFVLGVMPLYVTLLLTSTSCTHHVSQSIASRNTRGLLPFEILEMIRDLAHRLVLPPNMSQVHNMFHVSMLRTYEPDPTHVLNYEEIEVDDKVSYVERLIRIEDQKERVLRNKTIPMVKVIWEHHGTEGATWKSEEMMQRQYPQLCEQ